MRVRCHHVLPSKYSHESFGFCGRGGSIRSQPEKDAIAVKSDRAGGDAVVHGKRRIANFSVESTFIGNCRAGATSSNSKTPSRSLATNAALRPAMVTIGRSDAVTVARVFRFT